MILFRKHKYRCPETRTVPLEAEFDILVGSRVLFEAGNFTSVGQPVDEVNFSDESQFELEWDAYDTFE